MSVAVWAVQTVANNLRQGGVHVVVTNQPNWWSAAEVRAPASRQHKTRASAAAALEASAPGSNSKSTFDGPSPASTIISDGKANTNQTDSTTVTTKPIRKAGAAHNGAGTGATAMHMRPRSALGRYVLNQQNKGTSSHARTADEVDLRDYVRKNKVSFEENSPYIWRTRLLPCFAC